MISFSVMPATENSLWRRWQGSGLEASFQLRTTAGPLLESGGMKTLGRIALVE
ncbi:MAG: hypothetical protein LAO78_05805 [Acidobacteriia bacterium]|nr:hypothetical protein [Terriglobia bacterium]